MKNIFDPALQEEITQRIQCLNATSKAQWGKMTAYQMVNHCIRANEMFNGQRVYKQKFMGILLGKWLLKQVIKDNDPMRKNTPTVPDLLVTETTGKFESLKQQWITQVKAFEHYSNDTFIHPFFGRMNREEIGILVYKHTDHHLRQFGC